MATKKQLVAQLKANGLDPKEFEGKTLAELESDIDAFKADGVTRKVTQDDLDSGAADKNDFAVGDEASFDWVDMPDAGDGNATSGPGVSNAGGEADEAVGNDARLTEADRKKAEAEANKVTERVVRSTVRHNGKTYEKGARISLKGSEAKVLDDAGVLKPLKSDGEDES